MSIKKSINFIVRFPVLLSIPLGILVGLILTNSLSPNDQQNLAEYGLDRSQLIAISTITFFGAGILGYFLAQSFRISQKEYLIQSTKSAIANLEISRNDKEFLLQGLFEVEEYLNRNPSFCQKKVVELFQQFADPSVDKKKAMREFQEVIRSI